MAVDKRAAAGLQTFTPSWDLYACAIIVLSVFIQALSWDLFPFFIDIYYHLAVMLGFNTAGGYTAVGFWEYAPVGRPHLYPPLLHIVMLLFFKIGFSKMFIARFLSFIIFPLAVTGIWFFMRNMFGKRTAFFSVLIASSCHSFYFMSSITIPASLAVLSGLASFLCIGRGRRLAAVVFLAYSFYLHALMPWVISSSFLIYGLTRRKDFPVYARTVILAMLLAAPILINQYLNRSYFVHIDMVQDSRAQINILLVLFMLAGVIVSLRSKEKYYFPVILLFSFAILIPLHRFRFISAEGLYGFIPLAAIGVDRIYGTIANRKTALSFAASVIILFFAVSPSMDIDRGVLKLRMFNSTFAHNIFGVQKGGHGMARSVFFKKYYNKVAAAVERHSLGYAIIYSNLDYFGGIIGVLTERATSNAMLPEIKPFRQFDPVRAASLIVWLKDPDIVNNEPHLLIEKYGLNKIKDFEIAYIYRNPHPDGRVHVPAPIIPNAALFTILLLSIAVMIIDFKK